LLGGEIRLVSSPGHGSSFTLYLPAKYSTRARKASGGETLGTTAKRLETAKLATDTVTGEPEVVLLVNEVGDDRNDIQPGDNVILIVENDLAFAKFILEMAHNKGYKGLVTSMGAAALALTQDYRPSAILLDIHLPDMMGWRVLERLRNDIMTRHIPVSVISTDDSRDLALESGALAFIAKPVQNSDVLDKLFTSISEFLNRAERQVVLVEPDAKLRSRISKAISTKGLRVKEAKNVEAALKIIRNNTVDGLIVNPQAIGIIEELRANDDANFVFNRLSMIVYGAGEIEENRWTQLRRSFSFYKARSVEELLDALTLCLHRNIASLPETWRKRLIKLNPSNQILAGKKVLLVDDDTRNIFALTSILEEHDMVILSADNGRDAIQILQGDPNFDIVLMDIMMPEMDGMETIREIRKIRNLKNLPIVAVTAKAMKGDREKCIEAGAWDYLSKPVNTEHMMTVLRAWLHC
jgi:CheY-like chemotaxis protein